MKLRKLLAISIISIISLFTLSGCEPAQINTQTVGSFTEVESGKLVCSDGQYTILVHNETGVYYIATNFTSSGGVVYNGMTVLLNADGTPYTGK